MLIFLILEVRHTLGYLLLRLTNHHLSIWSHRASVWDLKVSQKCLDFHAGYPLGYAVSVILKQHIEHLSVYLLVNYFQYYIFNVVL